MIGSQKLHKIASQKLKNAKNKNLQHKIITFSTVYIAVIGHVQTTLFKSVCLISFLKHSLYYETEMNMNWIYNCYLQSKLTAWIIRTLL